MPDFDYPITVTIEDSTINVTVSAEAPVSAPELVEIDSTVIPDIIEANPMTQVVEASITTSTNTIIINQDEITVSVIPGGVGSDEHVNCNCCTPREINFGYTPQGVLTTAVFADNNKAVNFSYDVTGALESVENTDSDWFVNLTYDAEGRLLSIVPV